MVSVKFKILLLFKISVVFSFSDNRALRSFFVNQHQVTRTSRLLDSVSASAENRGIPYISRVVRNDHVETPIGFRIRAAHPEEIESLAILVAETPISNSEESDDIRVGGINKNESNRLMLQILQWVRRWTVYLGMLERLVKTNFAKGMQNSITNNDDSQNLHLHLSSLQRLYVVEYCNSSSNDNLRHEGNKSELVGVVELVAAPCPIPLTIDVNQNDENKQQRLAPMVCNLAIRPAYRRLGLARALLCTCERSILEDENLVNSQEIFLTTDWNNVPALRLYQQEGFYCEGLDPAIKTTRKNFTGNSALFDFGAERKCWMRKDLGHKNNKTMKNGEDKILRFVEKTQNEKGAYRWKAVYDNETTVLLEPTLLRKRFGAAAPLVSLLGAIFGGILIK